MKKKSLENYKKTLISMKQKILSSGLIKSAEGLSVSSDDLPDEADLASNVVSQEISFSIRNREMRKLKQIEEALQRISEGSYGTCDDCDAPISSLRLEKQPFATLCIVHAEEKEREDTKRFRRVS